MKIKRYFVFGLIILMGLFLVACGGGSEDGPGENQGGTEEKKKVTYTIKFENTSFENKVVEEGTSLAQPNDPEKKDNIFTGWYLDSNFESKATFPMIINKDTSIYAKFDNYSQAFRTARRNTIGDDVNSFEFDYNIVCTASYNALSLKGETVGNSKFSKDSEISFFDEHTNSGILFIDGTKYQIRKGTLLEKISLNEKQELKKFTTEQVSTNYKFDSSNFAKALFEWDDEKLKSIEKIGNNQYKLKTGFSYSDGIKVVGNYLNHPIIEKMIGSLPETSVVTDMKVKFENGYVSQYIYTMDISVTSLTFNLTYTLNFKNIDKVGQILPKTFAGVALTTTDINNTYSEIGSILANYKAQDKSSFDFKATTAVGFDGKNDINSTFKGKSIRKIDSGNVYFYNNVEVDSDYKNKDVYDAIGIKDIKTIKTKLSNNEVWVLEQKLIGGENVQVDPYQANDNDSYYLFNILSVLNNYTFAQKITNTKDSTVEYVFGLSNDKVGETMSYLETILDLDPLSRGTKPVKLFGEFSDIACEEATIKITLKSGALNRIEYNATGEFVTKLNDSRDFAIAQNATFKINVGLDVTSDFSSFEPYESVKKVK